ncbi:MAG: hypothetical protein LUC32_06410 [Clostridiales bacterium]|nr:hypothetical protein [Clostridiales bacterium]
MRTAFRKVIIISLVGIAFLIAMCVGWYYLASQNGRTLQADGYILDADSSADTIDAEYFSSGTSYSGVGLGTIRFQNTDGESVSVEEESFLHYTDGSVSAFADGIVLDLDDYDGGVVTYYSFPAQTVLAKTGTTYETDNNGYTLEFANFLYKLSGELYLIASESLTLTCPDGSTESFSDYAELTYLEEGIVCLQSADNLWTGVTTGAYLTLANGISIDLETLEILRTSGTASLLLTDISVSDGEAVEVTASDEWIPPTFNIETTDGEDGEDAADGESGSGGNGGTGGTAGADGTDGSTGQTGLTGATKDTESVGSSEVSPTMYLTSLDVTAGSVSFQIGLDEGTWELGVGTVQIINVATGAVVYSETVDFSNQDPYYPDITGTYDCSLLSPDTEYRILVSAEYSYESGATEVTGTKSFIDRTFYTDSTGVYLDSVEVTEDTVTANLEVKSWGLTADWQNIYMDILDADGTVVGTVSWSMTDITASGSGWSEDENGNYILSYTWFYDASDEASSTLTKDSALLSDATYTVRLYTTTAKEVQDPDEMDLKDSEEVRTLKEMPVIEAVHLDEYAGYFALSVDLTDEDGNAYDTSGVTSVTYTLSDSAGNTVWSETVYTTGAYNVSLEDAGLEVGTVYTLTAAVTVYDNEKTVTIEDPAVVDTGSISYVGAAVLTFTESGDGITFNSITGSVRV